MNKNRLGHLLATTALIAAVAATRDAVAVTTQIATDTTLGGSIQPFGPGSVDIGAVFGTIKGNNLFHSFSIFNVGSGDTVSFSGPSTIQNIITRVTGGTPSAIDGTIDTLNSASPMPGAN